VRFKCSILAAAALSIVFASRVTAQFICWGYAEGQCKAGWFSQAGYHYRLDRDIGGVHLFTWEVGPNMLLLSRDLSIGVSVLLGVDAEKDPRMGAKFRATRPAGPVDLDVGVGLLLIAPDPSIGLTHLTAHAGLRFADRILVSGTVEVIRTTSREARTAWYVGVAHQQHSERLSLPEVVFSLAAWVAVIALSFF
jgi:hypothetical protein